eukprot:9466118-Pyramimonas_sp.AAC.1
MQATVDQHGQQISSLNSTLSSTAEDSRATREMMERMLGMPRGGALLTPPRPLRQAASPLGPGPPAAPAGAAGP